MSTRGFRLFVTGVLGVLLSGAGLAADPVGDAFALARKGEFVAAAERLEPLADSSGPAAYYAGWMRARAGQWRDAVEHWVAIDDPKWRGKARTAAVALIEERALASYRARRYSDALDVLELAPELEVSAQAEALAGLSLLRLGRRTEARGRLASILPRLPEGTLRRDVEKILDQTSVASATEGWLGVGGGYNSNLFGDGASEEAVSAPFSDIDLLVRRVWAGRYYVVLGGRWQEYIGLTDDRYIETTMGAGVRYATGQYGLDVQFGAHYQNLGNDADAFSPVARATLERRLGASVLRLDYQVSRPLTAIDEFQTLNSEQHEVTLGLAPLEPGWLAGAELIFRREGGGDIEEGLLQLPIEHVALGARADVLAPLGARITLSLAAGVEHRIYDQKAFPGIEERRDWIYSLGGTVRHALGADLALALSVQSELNRSTLGANDVDDKNSITHVISAGLEWRL